MAKVKVKIPKLGLTITTARVSEWLKQVGDMVQAGETIATIEADKSSYELDAPVAGTLIEQLVPADDTVEHEVGASVAVIEIA